MEFINKKPRIYVLSGKAGAGKNLSASIIKDYYTKKNKKTVMISYASYLKEYAREILDIEDIEINKPRKFLQELGVELIKNKIDDKMLINRIIEDVKVYSYFYDVIVISDARFKEEITNIKDNFNNATVISIISDNTILTKEESMHITETALDNYNDYDYIIENTSSIYNLKEQIEKIIDGSDNNE